MNLLLIRSLRVLIPPSNTALVPSCRGCFPIAGLAALCSSFFPKALLRTLNLLFWGLILHLSQLPRPSTATKHAVNQLQAGIYCLPPSLVIHTCSTLINTGTGRTLRIIFFTPAPATCHE